MAFIPRTSTIGLQPIASTSTTANHPLGTEVQAVDPDYGEGTFVYLKGVASTVVGSWATINMDDGSTALLAADAIGPVGVAMSANVANQYGWYQRVGKAQGQAAADFADNGRVYFASTGVVDDAVSDGNLVHNAKGASTIVGAGLAEFEIDRPYTDDIAGND
jgi:hypothetical protein